MSLSNRAASKGGKGTKADKSHKSEKSESGKSSDKQQHRDANSKSEDPSIKDKVKMLIEMTQRSEEEVCYALHECDSDLTQAINMLFESMGTGEWETRVKKKKTRQASASKEKSEENAPVDGWDESAPAGAQQGDKEKPRNRNGPPPRLHRNNDSRGWRGRERQENDRNHNDSGRPDYQRDRDRRGRPGGPRGGGGGRGRGGGRTGGRYPPRGNRSNSYNKPIETWDNSNNTWDNSTALAATNNNPEETWDEFPGTDEWSTEEYQGSLADTKVFTPSVPPSLDAIAEPPGGQVMADPTLANPQIGQTLQMGQNMQMPSQSPVPAMVGALTAAQTQYFSQLQQNNDSLSNQYVPGQTTYEKSTSAQYNSGASIPYNSGAGAQYNANAASQYNSISTSQYSGTPSAQYSSTQQYGGQGNAYADAGYQSGNASYGVPEAVPAQQPPRAKTQRARVPPPSKIPASAVEMPGDLNSSIGYLDVQFGAMDLIDSSSSFDSAIDNKYASQTTTMDLSNVTTASALDHTSPSQNTTLDAYSPKTNTQSSISSALSQSLSNSDSIPQTSEHLASSTYSSVPRSTTQGGGTSTTGVSGAAAAAGGLELTKQPDSHSYTQPSTYNSYQSKANTYNSSSYVATTTTASSYVSNQANSYVNVNNQSGGGGYSAPSGNAYPNAYSSNSSYQSTTNSATFPSISQANTYSSNNQTYPQNTSQSVYGPNAGLSNSTYGNTSTSQYNNYSSNNKIVKDSAYDSSSSATSVSQAAATTNVTSSVPISLSQTTISVSKTSTTLAAKNSNSVVSNIPPGVTPVMSAPYLVGQVPYFHQQHVYSYEDMQLLQQRLPHMTTPYYDMPYPTPTTLAQVRDATLGNVGYSLSDGRFTRTDNNASPVPSTLSQQTSTLTQGHQAQPILAGTAPPYFFATAFNTIAPNYQFGTMYAQMPAATNAHGSNNSTQYPKPATYGSGYGSYDALNQSQDYTKGAYVGNTQAQKAAGANASSTGSAGNDLSAMYAKSHTALGKVNSYEKQGFHSGTPPPFTGALHGSQSAGLAPSGTGYAPQVYIPTMAPHQQHHSTHLMQQPLHQMDVRHQGRRVDSGNTGGQRSQTSNQPKTGAKQSYQTSYWNQA